MVRSDRSLLHAIVCAAWLAAAGAHGAEKYSDVKYVPPKGFAGHKWGELQLTFGRLAAQPLGVGAGWIRPV